MADIAGYVRKIAAQYPGCRKDYLVEVGKFIGSFDDSDQGRLMGALGKWTGKYAPNIGQWREIANGLGLQEKHTDGDIEWSGPSVMICRCCKAFISHDHTGPRCPNCKQHLSFTLYFSNKSAAALNIEKFGHESGPLKWKLPAPHPMSVDYKAWLDEQSRGVS